MVIRSTTEAEWVEARRHYLCSTDLSAALGLHPYRRPIDVWLDKTGRAEPRAENEAMRRGRALEAWIADEYAERTGRRLVHEPWTLYTIDDLFGATPDRLVAGAGDARGLECKTAGHRQAHRWGDPPDGQVPDEYFVQVQVCAATTGMVRWDLAALLGGDDFRVYEYVRDDALLSDLFARGREWWERHIRADLAPEPDASESFARYIRGRFPRESEPLADATPEETALAEAYRSAKADAAAAEAEEQRARHAVVTAIGDRAGIQGEWGKITYRAKAGAPRWKEYALALGGTDEGADAHRGEGCRELRSKFTGE